VSDFSRTPVGRHRTRDAGAGPGARDRALGRCGRRSRPLRSSGMTSPRTGIWWWRRGRGGSVR